jgi:hypothetical protein
MANEIGNTVSIFYLSYFSPITRRTVLDYRDPRPLRYLNPARMKRDQI